MRDVNKEVSIAELELGDTIRCFDGPFGTGVVQNVDSTMVKIFRVYAKCEDFRYTGGVICYTGAEVYELFKTSKERVFLYRRNPPK